MPPNGPGLARPDGVLHVAIVSARPPNQLVHETSPYLLAHAGNPVDWSPWDETALGRARAEDKPIFLSIGYAACHWCHVMERESFEDERIAAVLNRHFVPIKVDRLQRPDLDEIYMAATVALSGSGGWPMSVFLTPELEPFFCGTYFPPEDVGGRPGFLGLLARLVYLWEHRRGALFTEARAVCEMVRRQSEVGPSAPVGHEQVAGAARALGREFDSRFGGFGAAPKFPPHAALRLLLRQQRTSGDPGALAMVTATLDGMKNGGIYDQLGGGFARYSTDARWLVPHFEKMLSDNAELAGLYLEAFQATGESEYRRVASETLDWVLRDLESPDGGFYAATDADSEGEEGKYFRFTPDEIAACLDPEEVRPFCRYYGITERGHTEVTGVLHTPRPLAGVARELGLERSVLSARLARARQKVLKFRERRVPPATDDQVIVAHNGLMLRALAEASEILSAPRYGQAAERAAQFLMGRLRGPDGRLVRAARGGEARGPAFLDDYAYLADGLVSLYQASGEGKWLTWAAELGRIMAEDFGGEGGFYQTATRHEPLIARVRFGDDRALPNANAVAARALARLSHHLDRPEWRERARSAIMAYGRQIDRSPSAFATSLCVLALLEDSPLELVLVGSPASPDTVALTRAVAQFYLPDRVMARVDPSRPYDTPLVRGKGLERGQAALYVCRDYRCEAPLTSPEQVPAALEGAGRRVDQSASSERS
jgi:uncharacterized protein